MSMCHTPSILTKGAGHPLIFHCLILSSSLQDLILKFIERFSDRYGMGDLNIAMQLESGLSCTAERSTISTVYDFFKGGVNEEQLHSKIWQFLASNDLNSPTRHGVIVNRN